MPELSHFIHGEHVSGTSGRSREVFNPVRGEVTSHVPLASLDEVSAAVDSAQRAFPEWSAINPQRRGRILLKWVDLIAQHRDELAEMLSNEHGKTFEDAKGDIQRGVEVVEFGAGAPHLLKGEFSHSVATGMDVHSLRQPLGVVGGITPFNFPAMIPLWKAGTALAAGNTFVLKPSERDPSVPLRLAELALEAGMPPGTLNVVNGDKEAVDALIEDPRVKAVGFVGSTPIAQAIYSAAAAAGKRAQCFGGAKNHMVIMPDADLDQAADALIGAGYGSAGERCMAISVAVPVGEATAQALREKLEQRIAKLRVGPSLDPTSDFGPVVGADAKERIENYIGIGAQEGAELVVDGRGAQVEGYPNGYWVGATLFDHVTPQMRIYKEEIFGPVLCIVRAADYEEALRLPTEHEFGNGVAIFTRDGDTARDFTSRVEVGMVGVNVPIPVPIAYYTFGGWKASGFGDLNQHGTEGLKFYTKTKTVSTRWPSGLKEGASFIMPEGS
ncbi:CoA-acylating methylmalonate-semialdehyde dehydrogenase [Nesterenkonia alkaliphila]|uniref:methylmalonate-semialdehyde dehydrogenase (CoA acylating) n=1 Tax=Nesterenkonia alkaliphila TaxID=1463631 RepID=A0A7K1UK72_9MICC|nr:CoA-acylating methylmalonate-semialdehyde dehydrogenase [Nesterenkonia alkaliphila]MVT26722.1 CoA-acylating methylmalonate-semialdehyde dehydrogenase [Nesterenkonia alkaliphila]GFZ76979.1 putative methylmalonic acid semialdehyde dehydrogenase MmsA [Nesterenkonia alkaliphila]